MRNIIIDEEGYTIISFDNDINLKTFTKNLEVEYFESNFKATIIIDIEDHEYLIFVGQLINGYGIDDEDLINHINEMSYNNEIRELIKDYIIDNNLENEELKKGVKDN